MKKNTKMLPMDQFETKVSSMWWAVLLRGLIFIMLGVLLLRTPLATSMVLMFAFGIYLFIDGIVMIITSIANHKQIESWGILTTYGVLAFLVGLVALFKPIYFSAIGVYFILLTIGIILLVSGIIQMIASITEKSWSLLLGGIVSLLLGIIYFSKDWLYQRIAIYLIALIILINGIVMIILSYFLERRYAVEKENLTSKERSLVMWLGLISFALVGFLIYFILKINFNF